MVTWGGFIAKIVEFLVTKWAGRKIDFALNDKKQAARAFLRLHQTLGELSTLTKRISLEIDSNDRDDGRVSGAWLYEIDSEVSALSNEFFRIGDQLDKALTIFDPTLHTVLLNLSYSKASLLVSAAQGFKAQLGRQEDSRQIDYTYPNAQVLEIDYTQHYEWLQQNENCDWGNLEWPQTVLFGLSDELYISEGTIPSKTAQDYPEKLKILRDLLDQHGKLLDHTNTLLAGFIRENFSIEDVLYN